jgi:hypothetical protein
MEREGSLFFHKRQPFVSNLSQFNPAQSLTFSLCKILFNITLPCSSRSPKIPSLTPMHATGSAYLVLLELIFLIKFGGKDKVFPVLA